MPISDSYVVQYLLESSRHCEGQGSAAVAWVECEAGFRANHHGLRIEIREYPSRVGSQAVLIIKGYPERVEIIEPLRTGLMMRSYASEDEARLARLLRELQAAAARQCAARQNRSLDRAKHIRQQIFRRLIGVPVTEPESVV